MNDWSQAPVSVVEHRYCLQNNVTVELSKTSIESCTSKTTIDGAFDQINKRGCTSKDCTPKGTGCDPECFNKEVFLLYQCTNTQKGYGQEGIKELLQSGPVAASMALFQDFIDHREGVYRHVHGKYHGGMSIKIVGYGTDHWIVEGIWGEDWGEKGYARVAFGQCEIDVMAYACEPVQ